VQGAIGLHAKAEKERRESRVNKKNAHGHTEHRQGDTVTGSPKQRTLKNSRTDRQAQHYDGAPVHRPKARIAMRQTTPESPVACQIAVMGTELRQFGHVMQFHFLYDSPAFLLGRSDRNSVRVFYRTILDELPASNPTP
jgi:hypothetical protein